MSDLSLAAEETCRALLGATRANAEIHPPCPYKRRQQCTVRVDIGTAHVFATHRRSPKNAEREAAVLNTLNEIGAAVPKLLAVEGNWLIQEDAGRRLTLELFEADEGKVETLIHMAMQALAGCQSAGQASLMTGDHHLRLCGHQKMLRAVPRLGKMLNLPAPDIQEAAEILENGTSIRRFIKWDTRLSNAVIANDGKIVWVDWDECGLGDPARDVVKILCDDWMPDLPEVEERLIEEHLLPLFDGWQPGQGKNIIALYGALLSIIRIEQILHLKDEGPWWDVKSCLAHDLIVVTPQAARLHCLRGARWARRSPASENLAPWLENLSRSPAFEA